MPGTFSQQDKRKFSKPLTWSAVIVVCLIALACIPQVRFAVALTKGDIEQGLGFKTQAMSDYQAAVDINNASEEALTRLVALLQDNRRNDKAITYLKILSQMKSNSAQITAAERMAQISLNQKDFGAALKYSDQWIALAPENARAYHAKGDALAGLNKYDEALEALDKSLQIDPGSGAAADRDALLQKSRMFDTYAESVAHPQLENKGADYEALLRDCMRVMMAGNDKQAEEIATKAMQLEPTKASPCFLRGWIRFEQHHWDGALTDMQTAERLANHNHVLFPQLTTGQLLPSHFEFSDILFYEGFIEFYRKNYKSALANMNRAIALRKVTSYYVGRARVYDALGRKQEAHRDMATAIKIAPPKEEGENLPIKQPVESLLLSP